MATRPGQVPLLDAHREGFVGAGHARDSDSAYQNAGPDTGYPLSADVQDVPVHSSPVPDSAKPLKGGIRRRGLRSGISVLRMSYRASVRAIATNGDVPEKEKSRH